MEIYSFMMTTMETAMSDNIHIYKNVYICVNISYRAITCGQDGAAFVALTKLSI